MAITAAVKWIMPVAAPTQGAHKRAQVQLVALAGDATNEADVVKVDRSAIFGPNGAAPKKIAITRIQYSVASLGVKLYFEEAGGDEVIAYMSAGSNTEDAVADGEFDWTKTGGMVPAAAPAVATDGDIKLSTYGAALNSSYSITLDLKFKAFRKDEVIV